MTVIHEHHATSRPPLGAVAPLTHAICWGFAVVNFALAMGCFFLLDQRGLRTPLLLVNTIMTFNVWGFIFLSLSVIMTVALMTNDWSGLRRTMLIALVVKASWAVMLILRTFDNPATFLWTAVWCFFGYIQAVTYIYFLAGGSSVEVEDPVGE